MMRTDYSGRQSQGDRQEQQDSFGFADAAWRAAPGVVGVVADGVGGLTLGGEASRVAVEAFLDVCRTRSARLTPAQTLAEALDAASNAVLAFGRQMDLTMQCASTIVVAAIEDGNLWWIAAGDSRAYLLRGKRLHQLTADHNRLMTLYDEVAAGTLTRPAAEADPERGSVTSALGMPHLPQVDRNLRPFPLVPGDRVLLCTDGVYHAIGEEEMIRACEQGDSRTCCDTIVRLVASRAIAGQDNYTVVLMTVADNGRA